MAVWAPVRIVHIELVRRLRHVGEPLLTVQSHPDKNEDYATEEHKVRYIRLFKETHNLFI